MMPNRLLGAASILVALWTQNAAAAAQPQPLDCRGPGDFPIAGHESSGHPPPRQDVHAMRVSDGLQPIRDFRALQASHDIEARIETRQDGEGELRHLLDRIGQRVDAQVRGSRLTAAGRS